MGQVARRSPEMPIIAQLNQPKPDSGFEIALFAAIVVAIFGVRLLARSARDRQPEPDPWEGQLETAPDGEPEMALCHRCLTPHEELVDFCPKCGAAVGRYTNLLPFPYIYSIGHTLRIGTDGEFKRSPLTVFGFILVGCAEYGLFAPFYLLRLWLGPQTKSAPISREAPPPAESQ